MYLFVCTAFLIKSKNKNKFKKAVYRLQIVIWRANQSILLCVSPHLLTTLSESKRCKLSTVFDKLMEWHFNNFEASTEVIQESSRAKYEVIFCLAFEGGPVSLLCRHSVSATPDYKLPEGPESKRTGL